MYNIKEDCFTILANKGDEKLERAKIGELWVKEVVREIGEIEVVLTTNREKATEIEDDDLKILYTRFENSLKVVSIEIKEFDITHMKWMSL